MQAVENNPYELEYASSRLQDDKEVILRAMNTDDISYMMFFEYASQRLRDDKETVINIIRKSVKTFQFASKRLQENGEIIKIRNQAEKDERIRNMSYWYGWKIIDTEDDIESSKKNLSLPDNTYKEAEESREGFISHDIYVTEIFEAESRDEAEAIIEKIEFKNFSVNKGQ